MSIIHKALKKASEKQEEASSSEHEGFFTGKNGFMKKERFSTKRISIILASFVIIVAILFFIIRLKEDKKFEQKEPSTPASVVMDSPESEGSNLEGTESEGSNDYLKKALLYYKGRNYKESINYYNKALETVKPTPTIYNNMGLAHFNLKEYEESLKYFEEAIKMAPNCLECLNSIGMAKTVVGDNDLAEVYLKKAIKIKIDYADPYFNLGVLYEKTGGYNKAVNYYTQFLMLVSPDNNIAELVKKRIAKLTSG